MKPRENFNLKEGIVTHRPANVQFCSLDSVPCRSHLSLAVVLSLKVVSTRQWILLNPFLPSLCRHNLQFSCSSPFVGYLPLLCEPALNFAIQNRTNMKLWSCKLIRIIWNSERTLRVLHHIVGWMQEGRECIFVIFSGFSLFFICWHDFL